MYYELTQIDPQLILAYEDWLRLQGLRHYRLDRRLFVKFDPSQFDTSRTPFGGMYIPAPWFADIIKLTQHYPAAHRQLQLALANGTSVEAFASSLAVVFCREWQQIRDIQPKT